MARRSIEEIAKLQDTARHPWRLEFKPLPGYVKDPDDERFPRSGKNLLELRRVAVGC